MIKPRIKLSEIDYQFLVQTLLLTKLGKIKNLNENEKFAIKVT